jgi:mRNA interferase MazF
MVIVQDGRFESTNSVTICPFTTDQTPAPLFRIVVEPSAANGFVPLHASCRQTDQVSRDKLGRHVGRLDEETMLRLNRAMIVFLGIAG